MKFIKQLFCNHTSQHCINSFGNEYINNLSNNKPKFSLWVCERCGKIIRKKIKEQPSTFNWLNIRIKNEDNVDGGI